MSVELVDQVIEAIDRELVRQNAGAIASRPILIEVLKVLRNPTDAMVHYGEGITDFILPHETHDNSMKGRHREMRMAYQGMVDLLLKKLGVEYPM